MPPVRRQAITIAEKKAIRNFYSGFESKPGQKAIKEWFEDKFQKNISQATISTVLSSKYDYLDHNEIVNEGAVKLRPAKYPVLENALAEWRLRMEKQNVSVSSESIRHAAMELWKKIPIYQNQPPPAFSNGWLEKFKKRHSFLSQKEIYTTTSSQLSPQEGPPPIHFQQISHNPLDSTESSHIQNPLSLPNPPPILDDAGSQPVSDVVRIHELKNRYAVRDIYNMDEISFFWKLTPKRNIGKNNVAGVERNKAFVTVTICCNADGTERLPLWIIGYSKNPRAFKNAKVPPHNLNIIWRHNGIATMNVPIMEEWLRWFDSQMEGRSVLLLLDSSSVHQLSIENIRKSNFPLNNVLVVLLPPNMTSISNPCEQGINKTFKAHYRRSWIYDILLKTEKDINPLHSINILQAVRWMVDIWDYQIEPATIAGYFRRSGVLGPLLEAEPEPSETSRIVSQLQQTVSRFDPQKSADIENFIDPPEELRENRDGQLVNQIAAQFLPDRDYETDEDEIIEPAVSLKDASKALDVILKFEQQQDFGDLNFIRTLNLYKKSHNIKLEQSSKMEFINTLF
ncbi:ARS-binding protein [Schizosaccharomyces octosporus yFS286]|uniref:ARS-binding protein n=1 Tax=Schizosaccharomyces octosporus (strain yFS286) TaxID=483514 RepID=S9RGD4_SCHOY|nr:ARS-binding protein [Schizosaccharomyces octosporus yFS286]EPX73104.1 ARS-binding protein [Schizosaccharomyces octosporus yFS286]